MLRGSLATRDMTGHESSEGLAGLLAAVAGGSDDALTDLYRRVESRIFSFALARLGDSQRAADVLNEVMLEVWRRAASFEGRSRALTWILGIAHHKIVDSLRRKERWNPGPPPDEQITDAATPSPFDRAHQSERRAAVRRGLERLSDGQRQVVHLAFFEDLSYPEIARILGIPEGTVKTRVFHAKKILLRHLERQEGVGI